MTRVAQVLRRLSLTAEQIATRSHINVDRVRSILDGADPSLAELRALARGLRIPLRVFATGAPKWKRGHELELLFRGYDEKFEPSVESVAAFVDAALHLLPPRQAPPDWLSSFVANEETYSEAHRLASLFRSTFALEREDEPLLDLPQLLIDRCGIILGRLHYSRYEGASLIAGGYCFIFISPRFPARMLFTIAHELGHLLAHRNNRNKGAVFERPSQIGPARRGRPVVERFVDAFASVLLLPDRGVGRALKQIRATLKIDSPAIGDIEILLLARIFGVSFEVAARRCEDLELLPAGGANALTAQLKKDFGNPERRASELNLPPRPRILIPKTSENLLKAATAKIEAGETSAGWVADHLGISISDLLAANLELTNGSQLRH